ncbi:MAG TPA: thioesterase family protein [Steroidobacteraceae bacterium]|nr:thioesterase family protein [Steroidobacteraceae bacterium]
MSATQTPLSPWDFGTPYIVTLDVMPEDIDAYNHVNNSVYLSWLDRAAWSHSAALGLSLEHCVALRRGMAAHRTEIDYLRAAVLGDRVLVATWIVDTDGKLRVERRFQVRRADDGTTLARARIHYVCIHLDSGRAVRMPSEFQRSYIRSVPEP